MKRVRFVMVGGFLGAGKTTTLARLARHYLARGQRVGLVTNDQAQDLVDTNSLRAQGFPVQEVPGACFCCRFDDLMDRVQELQESERPDVILAEPVGSCTDLVATVVQPPDEWRATTVQACGLWPFAAGTGTPMVGVPLGRNMLSGATLCCDPISWFQRAGLISSPSVFVLGKPGLGKSTVVRRMALGLSAYGVLPLVLGDLKPDYVDLVQAIGGQVVTLGRGRGHRQALAHEAAERVTPDRSDAVLRPECEWRRDVPPGPGTSHHATNRGASGVLDLALANVHYLSPRYRMRGSST